MSEGHDGARACVRRPLTKSLLGRSLCRHWYCFGGGGKCVVREESTWALCVRTGSKGGATIHEAFPSCKMMSEKHFLDVEECFVSSIYFDPFIN